MIKSWKHKGLKSFFEEGSLKDIQKKHQVRLEIVLDLLDVANCIEDLDTPGFRLHKLIGQQKNRWSMTISGNWRVTFEFDGMHAYKVDYEDYHE